MPPLFWEKSYGSITATEYYNNFLDLIVVKIQSNSFPLLMQDMAPSYTVLLTQEVICQCMSQKTV